MVFRSNVSNMLFRVCEVDSDEFPTKTLKDEMQFEDAVEFYSELNPEEVNKA